LTVLKPHLKGALYGELSFLLNNDVDVNSRNRIPHGLLDPSLILY